MSVELTPKASGELASGGREAAEAMFLAPIEDVPAEHRAHAIAARFLVQYSGHTREAYERDLRDWFSWCAEKGYDVLTIRRTHLDLYDRELEEVQHRAPSTRARRMSTLAGYYKTAVAEEVRDSSPLEYMKRPKVPDDSQTLGLSKEDAIALLRVARADGPRSTALVTLLLHDGLRISEALGIDVGDLRTIRGHRVARVKRKGGARRDVVLNAATWEAVSAYLGDRTEGPLFVTSGGKQLDRHAAAKVVRKLAKRAGVEGADRISPHSARHSFVTLSLEAGVPLEHVQDAAGHADPRTTQRYNRGRNRLTNHPAHVLGGLLAEPDDAEDGPEPPS